MKSSEIISEILVIFSNNLSYQCFPRRRPICFCCMESHQDQMEMASEASDFPDKEEENSDNIYRIGRRKGPQRLACASPSIRVPMRSHDHSPLRLAVRPTSIRLAEQLRMASHLASIVEQSDDAIMSESLDGTIVTWNRGAARLFGYTAEEAVGQPSSFLYAPDRTTELQALLDKVTRGEAVPQRETECLRKGGERVRVWMATSPIKNRTGSLIGISSIARDITEQVRVKQEMEAMNAELRRLSGQLMRMQDQERRRIARDLHDGAVQDMAGLALHLTALREMPAVRDEPQALRVVDDSLKLANEGARGLRTLSYLLHPPLLDELGLATALRTFAEGFSKRTGIVVRLMLPRQLGRLGPDVELALFRIVQESLANVHRHSNSPSVEIRATVHGDSLTMEVEDRGRGVPPAAPEPDSEGVQLGVGIPGMQERARQLGGKLDLESEPGRTLVRVRLPLVR